MDFSKESDPALGVTPGRAAWCHTMHQPGKGLGIPIFSRDPIQYTCFKLQFPVSFDTGLQIAPRGCKCYLVPLPDPCSSIVAFKVGAPQGLPNFSAKRMLPFPHNFPTESGAESKLQSRFAKK